MGLDVSEVYPKRLPDLFSAKPLIVKGRYATPGKGTIRLRGKVAGRAVVRKIEVELPGYEPQHEVLATLWARTKIADLMAQDYRGIQQGTTKVNVKDAITQLGLDYRLMTQFTSFVAVEEMTITEGGQSRRVDVPVEMPDGVSYEGVFGRREQQQGLAFRSRAFAPMASMKSKVFKGAIAQEAVTTPSVLADALEEEDRALSLGGASNIPSKLDASLMALLQKKTEGKKLSQTESARIQDGKVLIQVWLNKSNKETLEQLKKLGFQIVAQPKSGHVVIGKLPVEKLEALSKLEGVRYVTFQSAVS